MRIDIIKGEDPKLKIPKFVCDKALKTDVPSPYHLLVDGFKFILFVGRPASGKTSHMISLFKDKRCLRKVWNNVILIMPKTSLNSLKEGDNIFKDIDPDKQYEDIDDIGAVYQQVKKYSEDDETSVIIIDDQMSKLKNPAIEKVLTHIVANRRHLKTSIILLTQILERVPLKLRKLTNVVITMYRPSKKELTMTFEEFLEQKEDTAQEIGKLAFQKPFDFLFIDVPSQRLFSNYDEIIIKPE